MMESTAALIQPKPQALFRALSTELPPWFDIIAFSPERWSAKSNGPRELMIRCSRNRRVFFFEEPLFDAADDDYVEIVQHDAVKVLIPHLRVSCASEETTMTKMVGLLLSLAEIHNYLFWYFCPFPVRYTSSFEPRCSVYDCVNEPSWLRDAASPIFEECERKLRFSADVIFLSDPKLYLTTSPFRDNVYLLNDALTGTQTDWERLWQKMSRVVCKVIGNPIENHPIAN